VIAKKLEDGRNVSDRREGCVAFPVVNSGRVDPDSLRDLTLNEIPTQPTAPDVIAQGIDFLGIAR
jgi:hypothetical protein